MRVAIVHDDLMQWGGAERILLGLTEIYPDAPIFTSIYDSDNLMLKRHFVNKKIITSFLQKIPGWKMMYKTLLPFYPIAFEQFNFDNFDLVISHTTRFAKSIITKPQTKHICFCHTPPRFLWHFSGNLSYGLGEILMSKLRLYDQISASRVDCFLAGSKNAQKRIRKIYKRESEVLYPYVDLERFSRIESFNGDYYLAISRPNRYKRIDLAQQVCSDLGIELKVISGGLDERLLVQVLAGCRALIIPGEEDFGLVSLEAQALGKPVIAYKKGGSLETVIDGKTGIFFEMQTVDSLAAAIKEFNKLKINPDDCRQNAKKYSKEKFILNFRQIVANLG